MTHIAVLSDYDLILVVVHPDAFFGELRHIRRNTQGGSVGVPVGHVFGHFSPGSDGFNPHWHVRLFLRATVTFDAASGSTVVSTRHDASCAPLMPSALASPHVRPELPGAVVQALLQSHTCTEPLFLSVHHAAEIEGTAYGQVFVLE